MGNFLSGVRGHLDVGWGDSIDAIKDEVKSQPHGYTMRWDIWHEYLEELWSKASSLFEKSEVQIGANRRRYFALVIFVTI